jgi:KEOPS complex subunit Cgi121
MRLVEGIAHVDRVDEFVATLADISEETGATVQAFDARYVVSRAHLERALAFADRARERDDAIARDRAVEVLLFAAGRRQIDRALRMGVNEGDSPVVVLVDGGDERAATAAVAALLDPADTLGGYDEELVCAFFEIGEAERAATDASLADLVLERVALLEVEK